MRRWQYSKALSRSRSRGGSRRLEEEAADSTDRVEPSSSDLSSEERTRAHKGTGGGCPCKRHKDGRHCRPKAWGRGFPGRPPPPLSAVRFVPRPVCRGEGVQRRCLGDLADVCPAGASPLVPARLSLRAPRASSPPTRVPPVSGVPGPSERLCSSQARSMEKACTFSHWSSVKRWPVDSTVKKSVATAPSTSVTGPGFGRQGRTGSSGGPLSRGGCGAETGEGQPHPHSSRAGGHPPPVRCVNAGPGVKNTALGQVSNPCQQ